MKINNTFKLIISVIICEMAGGIGAVFTTPAIRSGWYAELVKPSIAPPNWVFGPVWTGLFALMGISLFLIWKRYAYNLENVSILRWGRWGVGLFVIQLVLNALWSIIFFGLRSPGGAFIEIIFLWIAILATIIAFAKISKPAAWLLMPYIFWVSFALYLNYAIWALN